MRQLVMHILRMPMCSRDNGSVHAGQLLEGPEYWHQEYRNDESQDVERQSHPHKIAKAVVADTLYN